MAYGHERVGQSSQRVERRSGRNHNLCPRTHDLYDRHTTLCFAPTLLFCELHLQLQVYERYD